jgi:hypothetical protein
MYASGERVRKDTAEATKWYRKAAEQGNASAQFGLGVIYSTVQQDYAEAAKWLRKAAEQGNSDAQAMLVALYERFPALRNENTSPIATAAGNVVASPTMPQVEGLLIAAVERARAAYAAGANDMARGAARPARAREICAVLANPRIAAWVGTVETLSSNSDGLGVLSIQIAEGISIKTWNNALSDTAYQTLIDPGSPIFKVAVTLKEGQSVTFGGQFFPDKTDCFKESSLTLKGSLTQPAFIFRFSNIAPIE